MKKTLIIILVILALFVFSGVGSYNGLVTANEDVNSKWSTIDTMLQRRADLIPNLVSTVKGYASHEKEILANISDARARLAGAQNPQDKANADAALSGALSRLLVVVENYPDLKANQTFTQLMDELTGSENRIAVSRKDYNDAAQVFNAKVKSFPTVIIANLGGFPPREYFQAKAGAENPPQVDFAK